MQNCTSFSNPKNQRVRTIFFVFFLPKPFKINQKLNFKQQQSVRGSPRSLGKIQQTIIQRAPNENPLHRQPDQSSADE